jgi:K(+)-stimulated pyrophosphate-energized sodium pump
MYTATSANARTAIACQRNIAEGLQVAFASGAVMGNGVVGLALAGLWVLYLIWTAVTGLDAYRTNPDKFDMVWGYLAGFGFGASSIGMFARVGGGVFTKAADVGADLVGKVEQVRAQTRCGGGGRRGGKGRVQVRRLLAVCGTCAAPISRPAR